MTKSKEEKITEDAVKDINCFIIMPISNQLGYEPGHFSLVYEDIIKPAVIAAGMKPIRADETRNTNLIQLDILRKVIESDIAICDMSAKNPNVFYELGVRQAFDKPTVLMIDDETTAPFDVSSLRYVDYKKGMGFREVKKAVEDLTQALRETYDKKDDTSEINSLIRLMDLTTPAQFNQVDISAEDRTAIQISELASSMHNMQAVQHKILDSLNQTNRLDPDTMSTMNTVRRLIADSKNKNYWQEIVSKNEHSAPNDLSGPKGLKGSKGPSY